METIEKLKKEAEKTLKINNDLIKKYKEIITQTEILNSALN